MEHDNDTKSRIVAKVLRDVLRTSDESADLADLTDLLKVRLALLKIQVSPSDISAAYAMVSSNRGLVRWTPSANAIETFSEPPTLQPKEAQQIYRAVMDRYRREHIEPEPIAQASEAPEYFPALVCVS